MPSTRREHERKVREKAKQARDEYSNYVNAVILISSIEAWFEFQWGPEGQNPGHLEEFDRFPAIGERKPDFLARFRTPYILCGEYMKTFRRGAHGRKDLKQVIAYSRWEPPEDGRGTRPKHDVLLLVAPESDDAAAAAIETASKAKKPKDAPKAPIVIVGIYLDTTRAQREWYTLKWRAMPGNQRFSSPNVLPEECREDLNGQIADASHCTIRVDRSALALSGRNPFINDTPPPLYTVVRAVYPALNELLTDTERDVFSADGRVTKTLTRDQLMRAPVLQTMELPLRYIQDAIDWLVENSIARRAADAKPPAYEITLDAKSISDLSEFASVKTARAILKKRKARRSRARGKKREHPRQQMLF